MVGVSTELKAGGYRSEQFIRQARWVASALGMPPNEVAEALQQER
jgi:hypothetical protein